MPSFMDRLMNMLACGTTDAAQQRKKHHQQGNALVIHISRASISRVSDIEVKGRHASASTLHTLPAADLLSESPRHIQEVISRRQDHEKRLTRSRLRKTVSGGCALSQRAINAALDDWCNSVASQISSLQHSSIQIAIQNYQSTQGTKEPITLATLVMHLSEIDTTRTDTLRAQLFPME